MTNLKHLSIKELLSEIWNLCSKLDIDMGGLRVILDELESRAEQYWGLKG